MAEIRQIQVNGTNYDIYSPEVYSTNEIEVGTWIDGSTIYKKHQVLENLKVEKYNQNEIIGELKLC